VIPLSAIAAHVRTRFEAESVVRWFDSAIHTAIGEGLERNGDDTLDEGRSFYDLRGYAPDDFVSLRAVWSTVRSDWLVPASEAQLHPRWEEDPGDPDSFFLRGWCWLGVYPHASGSSGYLRAYLSCLAPQLTHDQAVLSDLPDDLTPALEDYALYDLQAQDGETGSALAHWGDFVGRQRGLGDFVKSRGKSSGFIGGRR